MKDESFYIIYVWVILYMTTSASFCVSTDKPCHTSVAIHVMIRSVGFDCIY